MTIIPIVSSGIEEVPLCRNRRINLELADIWHERERP
jgi:hypothetical protein